MPLRLSLAAVPLVLERHVHHVVFAVGRGLVQIILLLKLMIAQLILLPFFFYLVLVLVVLRLLSCLEMVAV